MSKENKKKNKNGLQLLIHKVFSARPRINVPIDISLDQRLRQVLTYQIILPNFTV